MSMGHYCVCVVCYLFWRVDKEEDVPENIVLTTLNLHKGNELVAMTPNSLTVRNNIYITSVLLIFYGFECRGFPRPVGSENLDQSAFIRSRNFAL